MIKLNNGQFFARSIETSGLGIISGNKKIQKEVRQQAKIYQNQKAARRLTWNDDQLEKLAEYRDKLMGKEK